MWGLFPSVTWKRLMKVSVLILANLIHLDIMTYYERENYCRFMISKLTFKKKLVIIKSS